MSQQLGATIPGLTHTYGSQSGLQIPEDPSLYVNFDDEDEDFQTGRRVAVNYDQQRQRDSAPAQPNPPSRVRQATNSASLPQSRPSSGAAIKSVSGTAADQELENLRRRIAEKERQIKAQRQSAHSNTGAKHVARLNPALGPVLRGLHRKQSPVADDTSKQVDAFLKEVSAGVSAKSAGVFCISISIIVYPCAFPGVLPYQMHATCCWLLPVKELASRCTTLTLHFTSLACTTLACTND